MKNYSLAVLAALALTAFPLAAVAQPQIDVIADGLNNPRGITFGPFGLALYVAEAGLGGEGPPCIPDPGQPEVELCLGQTGSITVIFGGVQYRFVDGLPSLARADGSESSGPHDVSFSSAPFRPYVAMGSAVPPEVLPIFPPEADPLGKLLRLRPFSGFRTVADLGAFEVAENPEGPRADSNPYSVAAIRGGALVVDAAGNDLLRVGNGGQVTLEAVFSTRPTTVPWFPVENFPTESVPTAVTVGPDGAYYVGELRGFPFPPGEAFVWRIEPGGEAEVFADGFTQIIDLDFGPDGSLYVLEISVTSLALPGPGLGAIKRVAPDGSRSTLLTEPLNFPGGIEAGRDGVLYVTNCSVCPGGGEVLRIVL